MPETIGDIDAARNAADRRSWAEAHAAFTAMDRSRLSPRDLESLADAAWWLSKPDESIAARQRAYAGFAAVGDDPSAAGAAVRLCFEHVDRGELSVAMGWLMRADRHLHDHEECVEHGFLALCQTVAAVSGGELEEAMELAVRATTIGERFGDRDLVALGIHAQGRVYIATGRVHEGMALLDEAMTSVVAGELTPLYTGVIYCSVIDACLELGDMARASEWTEAARTWCESLPANAPYPGICRVSRAEVAGLLGQWSVAESEAVRASQELTFNPMAAARAFYDTGEIRLRIGNLAGAEEAFARAHEVGFEPQPGLALLRLAQGKTGTAASALRRALAGEPDGSLRRARLLAAQVEIEIANADLDVARSAADELGAIAQVIGSPMLDAWAATSRGALRLAEGNIEEAMSHLDDASAVWQELPLPYESARARVLYGRALRAAGEEDDARLELRAALAAFERLGAEPDAQQASVLLAAPGKLPGGLTPREGQVLLLVAAGKTNRDIATELVLSEHTVARHLQNIFRKLGVSSRAAATAFAFEHGLA